MMSLFKTDLAAGASLDMSNVNMLAGLGNNGRNPQHCHRQLITRLPRTPMPEKSLFWVPLSHSVYGGFEKLLGVVWPHELLAALYNHYNDAFWNFLVGSQDAVNNFWRSVRGRGLFKLWLVCLFDVSRLLSLYNMCICVGYCVAGASFGLYMCESVCSLLWGVPLCEAASSFRTTHADSEI